MTDTLTGFNHDLQQQAFLAADEEGAERPAHVAFTEHILDVLTEAGEVDDAEVVNYQARGARFSAYELSEDGGSLHLILTDYRAEPEVQSLTKADLEASFRRLATFLDHAVDGLWKRLEESSSAWDAAQRIDYAWPDVAEVRFTVLTNAALRTDVPAPSRVLDRPAHFAVWDLDRVHKLTSSGRVQEPINVDVEALFGSPIPCIGPHGEPGAYDAYLMVLRGDVLADLYDAFGPRLLERNVRSFLQSRGKVNRGIQATIKDEPARFLAYNNGISMTASAVRTVRGPDGGLAISAIEDLQIVNGGQTTASLHYARIKNKVDLFEINVQAKLSVVNPGQLDSLVPRISEFANSQNRINMADFTANDPFHVELEKLSRSVWAPGKAGSHQMTRWFYERARGSYADAHASERTPARQREFKKLHPLAQKFTKTDVAKFENTWDQRPWEVSLGAEKNFREFMLRLGERKIVPSQDYFESLVAKAILFRTAERVIGRLQLGGYRSAAVTYTLAKLLNLTAQRVDLAGIWREQDLPEPLADAIEDLAPLVHRRLVNSAGSRNVLEWAKRKECWAEVLDTEWTIPSGLSKLLVSSSHQRTQTTSSASIEETLSDTESAALEAVVAVPPKAWFELSAWAKETGNLQSWQRSLAFSLGRLASQNRTPTRKQADQGAKILEVARRVGFLPSDGWTLPADAGDAS